MTLNLIYCTHGVDLRLTPRCYLCRPWPDDSPVLVGVPVEHGYTCGECGWGRSDQPRSLADYVAHVNAEHPTGPHRDFPDPRQSNDYMEGFDAALNEAADRVRALPRTGDVDETVRRSDVLAILEVEMP